MNGNEMAAPQPVPDLIVDAVSAAVSDEERNRYGVLLDHAAERGLLSPLEYQARLGELAEATSIEQLQRIVTELPAFGGQAMAGPAAAPPVPAAPGVIGDVPARSAPVPGGPGQELDAALWASLTPASPRRGGQNRWMLLALVVVVLLVAMIGLALVASHVIHTHTGGTTGLGGAGLSRLRL